MLKSVKPNPDLHEILEKVWTPTPWMVNVEDKDREIEINNWCNRNLGRESSPIHNKNGLWHKGNVTMYGKTWYGFATEEIMGRFVEEFGGATLNREAGS